MIIVTLIYIRSHSLMDKIKDSGSFDASSILAGTSKKEVLTNWLALLL